MTDPLVAFAQARLDEDAAPTPVPAWHEYWCHQPFVYAGEDACGDCGATEDPSNIQLVPRSDRTLREVEVKRATIRMYEEALGVVAMMADHGREASHYEVAAESYLNVVRLWAAVHDQHPDYLPEWKPS